MKIFGLIASSWGQDLGIVLCVGVVVGISCAILGYFRDWLVSVFKIKAVLDKLEEVKRKLDEMERKINDIK